MVKLPANLQTPLSMRAKTLFATSNFVCQDEFDILN